MVKFVHKDKIFTDLISIRDTQTIGNYHQYLPSLWGVPSEYIFICALHLCNFMSVACRERKVPSIILISNRGYCGVHIPLYLACFLSFIPMLFLLSFSSSSFLISFLSFKLLKNWNKKYWEAKKFILLLFSSLLFSSLLFLSPLFYSLLFFSFFTSILPSPLLFYPPISFFYPFPFYPSSYHVTAWYDIMNSNIKKN